MRIGTATVTYYDGGAYTTYDDGASYAAQPHDTPDYCEVTQRCGYGTDTLAFCREHDTMHLICAEWFGFGDDNVIWKLAHGSEINLAEAAREEMMVQTAQAWVRGGIRPIIGDVDWQGLKRFALSLLGQPAIAATRLKC